MKNYRTWCWWILASLFSHQSVLAEEYEVFRNLSFQLSQQHGASCLQVESKDFELNSCIKEGNVAQQWYFTAEDSQRWYFSKGGAWELWPGRVAENKS